LRWRIGVDALVNRYRRAGASALAIFPRWRIGCVALVDVFIAALRLGIAALARRELFFFLKNGWLF
jgi:hypothetical protein